MTHDKTDQKQKTKQAPAKQAVRKAKVAQRSRAAKTLLNSEQMATFAARGFLRFDACVPEKLNQAFLREVSPNTGPAAPELSPQAH